MGIIDEALNELCEILNNEARLYLCPWCDTFLDEDDVVDEYGEINGMSLYDYTSENSYSTYDISCNRCGKPITAHVIHYEENRICFTKREG